MLPIGEMVNLALNEISAALKWGANWLDFKTSHERPVSPAPGLAGAAKLRVH
jgi:hypothetical protein